MPSVEDGSLQAYFRDVVAPQLPAVSRPAFLDAVATQAPVCMPNRRLTAAPTQKRGALLLGDAWNMRHPLTGGGMTVALKDVELFSACIAGLAFDDPKFAPAQIDAAIAAFQSRRGVHAATINVLANALYRVFSKPASDDGRRARLRAACIEYLSMGGVRTAGPVGLLAGLTPKPDVLVAHFFNVAAHAMRRAVLPVPTPSRLRQGYDLLHVACMIILPLLEAEGVSLLAARPVLAATNLLFPWRHVDWMAL
jgi:squalene monooxygenase